MDVETDTVRLSSEAWRDVVAHIRAGITFDRAGEMPHASGKAKRILENVEDQLEDEKDERRPNKPLEVELQLVKWNVLTGSMGRARSEYKKSNHIEAALSVERYLDVLKDRLDHQVIKPPCGRNRQFSIAEADLEDLAGPDTNLADA